MGWRADTRTIIKAYPDLKRRVAQLHTVSITPNYNGMPGSGEPSRTTEVVALRSLPPDEQRWYDAVSNAISTTMRYRNGDLRLAVINLVYWKATHTLEGAAMAIHVGNKTAQGWHSDFIELVDAYMRIL